LLILLAKFLALLKSGEDAAASVVVVSLIGV
jgi:hypothetical protein